MSRKETVTVEAKSDLSGQAATQERVFTIGGATYTLDLTDKEAATFDKNIGRYVAKAGSVSVQPAVLREWAETNGFEVGARGRISSEVLSAYQSAMGASDEADEADSE